MKIELRVVRRAAGEYDSYFCGEYYMLTLLQLFVDVSLPQNVRVSLPSRAGKELLRIAPNPHALLEANSAQPRRPRGMHNTLAPHPAINLSICSSPTTASKKYLDVTFTSLK